MVFEKVLLRGQQRDGLVFVAFAQRFDRARGHDLLELQLECNVILALFPCVLLVEACAAVDGQHLVACFLHEQALLGGVHRFERVGGRERVDAVSDEHAHVVDGEVGDAVVPGVAQVRGQQAVALVHVLVARLGGEAHAAQLVEKGLVHLHAVQARQQAVRGGALLVQFDELLHGRFVDEGFGCGCGCFGHG